MKKNFLYIKVKKDNCWDGLGQIEREKYNLKSQICDEGNGKYIIREDWECPNIKKLMEEIIAYSGNDVLAVTGTFDSKAKNYTHELFMGEFYSGKNGAQKPKTYTGESTVSRRKYQNIWDWISKEVFMIDKEAEDILHSFGVFEGWDMPFEYQRFFVTASEIEQFDLKGKKVAFTGNFHGSRDKLEEFVEKKGGIVTDRVYGTTNLLVVGLEDSIVMENKKFLTAMNQNQSKAREAKGLPVISEHEFMIWKKMKPGREKKDVKKSEAFYFGHYMHKSDLDAPLEPIEWIVLKEEKTKLLLISKYILDAKPFNDNDRDHPNWEKSLLRSWLNDEFLHIAFTVEEQKRIIKTKNSNKGTAYKYCGDTEDSIFLLRDADLKKYFASSSDAIAVGTEWAFEKGTKNTDEEMGCFSIDGEDRIGCWRLRTGGMFDANYVNWAGFKDDEMGSWELLGIRPVLWIKK